MSISNGATVTCEKGHVWDVSNVTHNIMVRAQIGYCIKPEVGKPDDICGARVVWINPLPINQP